MNRSVCILYGINEGPATGKQFVCELEQAGFTVSNDPTTADIIFAHSGGCYLIPPRNRAKHVVLAGIAYWPHRPWLLATARKSWREATAYYREHRLSHLVYKWFCYLRYAFKPRSVLRMALNRSASRPWNSTQPQIIIRNRHDVYCCPEVYEMPFRGPRTFISFPGEHDDCWDHPERYVHLLQSLQ